MARTGAGGRFGSARACALVLAAALLLLLPGLGRLGARETTDARYLEAARAMWATGDWLVPRIAGLPHLDKPPLAYWSGAAGMALLGPTPLAGRLLQQLVLAATAVLVFAFGRSRMGTRAGAAAAGVFLTSSLVFGTSRALATDLFQLFFTTAALIALYDGATRRAPAPTALAFACLGLSMWAKGPIALLVTLAVVLPFLALARLRLPSRGVVLGLALFAVLGAPWYALLISRDPSLVDYFVGQQLLSRVGADGEGHARGLLHLPVRGFVAGLLPWTPLVALALWRLRPRRGQPRDPLDLYLWLWTLAPLALFELFATKLATYLLPGFPGAALLAARALEGGRLADAAGRRAVAASVAVAAVACVLVAGLLGLGAWRPALTERWLVEDELVAPLAFAAALVAAAAALAALARRAARAGAERGLPALAAAVGAAFLLGYNALAAPFADQEADARIVLSVPGARVVQYGQLRPGLLFYLDGRAEHAVAMYTRTAREGKGQPEAERLSLRHRDVEAWMREDVPTFVLAKRRREAQLAEALGARTVRRTHHVVLLANDAAARALEAPAAVGAGAAGRAR